MSKATINHAGGVTVEPGGIRWETVGGKLTCLSVPRGRFGVDLQYEGVIKLGQDGEMVAYHYTAVHPDFVQAPDPMCVTLTVSCIDWVSRVDRAGMSRLYTVYFERDENPVHWDTVRNLAVFWLRASPSPCEFTWSELHRLLRLMETYVSGSLSERRPFLFLKNGGHCERICRENNAIRPHHDLQGRGVGK